MAQARTQPSKKKIMVVDNHPLILRFLLDSLQKQGHEVLAAEDALSALALLKEARPEVIFVDLIMPKISGDRLCRILRSKPEFRDTYLVILSAVAAEEQTDFASFGADACIVKGPFTSMSAHIQEVLRQIDAGTLRQHKQEIVGLGEVHQRQITRELLSSQRRLESILTHIAEGILEITVEGQVTYANPVALELLGLPEEKLLAARFCDLFPKEQQDCFSATLENGRAGHRLTTMSTIPYGKRFLDLTFLPVEEEEEEARSILVVIRDVSTSLRMKNALRESEKKYRLLFQEMMDGFVYLEILFEGGEACDYRFLEVNAAYEALLGLQAAQVIGKTVREAFPEDCAALLEKFKAIVTGQHGRFGHFCTINNRYFDFTLFRSEADRLAVMLCDVTERKRLEEKLHAASITDELTGLLNRRGFLAMAEKQLKIAAREKSPLFLLFADFDNLKRINDELGHKAGDQALAAAAALLRNTFRESDIIGRLGGDEFAILLTGPAGANKEQSVLARLEEKINEGNGPHSFGELSLSFGMARFEPQDPCTLDELIWRADQQMYQLKKRKKDGR